MYNILVYVALWVNFAFSQSPVENLTNYVSSISLDANTELYDRYFGKKVTDKRNDALRASNASPTRQSLQHHKQDSKLKSSGDDNSPDECFQKKVFELCTVAVKKCDPTESRRIDGSCTNPNHPSRGVFNTPFLRLLPHNYGTGNTLRPATDGTELPSTRLIRQEILPTGERLSKKFTTLLLDFSNGVVTEYTTLQDVLTYSLVSECCIGGNREPNRASPRCISISVPDEDPYLANTPVRCLNLTRMQTFQDLQCIPPTLPADRTNYQTPIVDLSAVYGVLDVLAQSIRQNQGGLLKEELRKGRTLPPGKAITCINNRLVERGEDTCYEMGDPLASNLLIGSTLSHVWFYLNHNFIARKLAKLNPCWDDDTLFRVARDINIAHQSHIFYYEANPLILGRKYLLKAGVIFNTHDYVDDFDKDLQPGTYLEHVTGSRYFHETQDGKLSMYSPAGKLLSQDTHSLLLSRSGYLEVNRTLEEVTQGEFRQPAGEADKRHDPALSMRVFGVRQEVGDLPSIDIMRNRDLGLAPYNHYREICGMDKAQYFSDFEDVIDKELVIKMSLIYNDVDDVDLSVGINAERLIPGTLVGPTLHCIMTKQLLHWRQSDIYWYEHSRQPTPFTLEQLNEIRKMTIARILCNNGHDVTEIQKEAFRRISHKNPVVSCSKIPEMNFKVWTDYKCKKN